MKAAIAVAALALAACAPSRPPLPDWIDPRALAILAKLGVDVDHDVSDRGNYHWSWRASHPIHVGVYACPTGSDVSISRSLMMVMTDPDAACRTDKGVGHRMLKINPDGSVEPLGDDPAI